LSRLARGIYKAISHEESIKCAMMAARLLFVVGSLQGRHVYSAPSPSIPAFVATPDVSDPTCEAGMSCSATLTGVILPDVLRGLCVATANGNMCWDACNDAHDEADYGASNPNTQMGIALMVKELRTGMRNGACPGAKNTPTCSPGVRCTPPQLTRDRGMCTNLGLGQGNQCVDMCDMTNPLTFFKDTPGKQAGTVATVEQVRGGRDPMGRTTCPGPSVWLWLWIPILLCCMVGTCFGVFKMFQGYKGLKKGQPSANRSQQYKEPDEMPFVEASASTFLTESREAGETKLHVESDKGFQAGRLVSIDEGSPVEEVNEITGFGSILLKNPLKFAHPKGAPVRMLPEDTWLPEEPMPVEPMPVMEPLPTYVPEVPTYPPAVIYEQAAPPYGTPSLFGGEPNLMAGLAPTTTTTYMQPAGATFAAPTTYSQYTTPAAATTYSQYTTPAADYSTVYPQASSMALGGNSTYGVPTAVSRPAYGGSTYGVPTATTGSALGTQMPAYGAYGAYGGVPTTASYGGVQPTSSMRIG